MGAARGDEGAGLVRRVPARVGVVLEVELVGHGLVDGRVGAQARRNGRRVWRVRRRGFPRRG